MLVSSKNWEGVLEKKQIGKSRLEKTPVLKKNKIRL